jgi:PAS domain S-box-containing protein
MFYIALNNGSKLNVDWLSIVIKTRHILVDISWKIKFIVTFHHSNNYSGIFVTCRVHVAGVRSEFEFDTNMNHQDTFENEFLGNFSYQNAVALNLNQPLPSTNNNILESNFFTRNDSNLDLEKDDTRAGLSRHVSSVISHFTSSKDGFGRLLNEMDDFIHCVTAKLEFLYASPSCNKAVGYSQDEIFGSPLKDVVHQDDWIFFVEYIQNSFDTQQEFLTHCRYISKTGNIKLMEIRGKPFTAAVDDTASNKMYYVFKLVLYI